VVLAAVTLLAASRGGLVGLVAGVVLVTVILFVQRRAGTDEGDRKLELAIALPAAVTALCTIVLLAALTAGDVARDVRQTTLDEVHDKQSKYQVWSDSTDLITDNRWLGVGHGAFEAAFTRLSPGGFTYAYAENDYLQAIVDWGLPGAAMLFLALLSTARLAARRWRHGPIEAGALAALAGLAIHDIADFSLEMPGVAMPAIATAALLLPAKLGTAQKDSGRVPPRAIATRGALVAAAAIIAIVALSPLGRGAREEPTAADANAAYRAWSRHAADYVLAARTADALFDARDPRSVKVVERALSLNPRHSAAHQLAGRMLAMSQHPEQSALEFAEAIRWSNDPAPVVADVLAVFPDPEAAAAALPTDANLIDRVSRTLAGHDDIAFAYAQRVGAANPTDADSQVLLAEVALDHQRGDLALPAARAAWDHRADGLSAILVGRALLATGDTAGAITFLGDALAKLPNAGTAARVNLMFALSDAQVAIGQLDVSAKTLADAADAAASDRDLAHAAHLKAAQIDEKQGNHNAAAWELDQARALE